MTVETFVTVIILSLGMSAPIVAAFNFVDTLAQVDEILKAEEQVHGNTPVTFASHDIEVKNVSFGYHADKEVLHGVSLSIPQNSMTALVGPSGSGKTTLAKLIAGFWDVKSGTITMGGHDLKDIPLTELYDQVAFVSQDNYLFDDTVRENIRMGCCDATDAQVEAAPTRRAVTASSPVWSRALTPWWVEAAPTSPAVSASASPLSGPC